jgi:hypothetical protein
VAFVDSGRGKRGERRSPQRLGRVDELYLDQLCC